MHEHSATLSSDAVPRYCRRAARSKLRPCRLDLSMSVGLHSGTVHFFLIGSTHRELVLAGRDASTAAAIGSAASAGEIGPSLETAARLPASAVRAREDVSLLAVDIDRDGGKLFFGSGVPQASEDDEGRMLRALRRLADAHTPLPLQFGWTAATCSLRSSGPCGAPSIHIRSREYRHRGPVSRTTYFRRDGHVFPRSRARAVR